MAREKEEERSAADRLSLTASLVWTRFTQKKLHVASTWEVFETVFRHGPAIDRLRKREREREREMRP